MAHRRQQWWNSFGFESKFKQRQIARVVVFALAYVAISTACMAAVYAAILGPLARGEMPLALRLEVLRDSGGIPGMAETVLMWVTLMTSLSVFFAVAVGLYFSHKLAGPLYRFKLELRRLAAGEATHSIKLRKGDDDFEDIADALNEVLARVQIDDGSASHRLESANAQLAELRVAVMRQLNDPEALRLLVEKPEA